MVTVVDGVNFMLDYQASESLATRGQTLGEDDDRSITDLLIEQIEFADVLLLSKIDLISASEREELMAILRRLNAHAEIVPMVMGAVPLKTILDTGRFDFERASQAPGWLKELRGEHVPETEEYGIASTAYRARRPFHPERFFAFIDRPWTNGKLLRSKGFFWLASKYKEAGSWSQAGGLMRHGMAGRWWRFVPQAGWPEDQESVASIMEQWSVEAGDCRQELVFIGQHIDFAKLTAELDSCLLTDAEMAVGVEGWQLMPDPFGPWQEEEAA
jgi:G3E family GTPase